MCKVYICQIVDSLSEKITHTFMASNHEHAVRQFQAFLESLKGKIHNDDFSLQIYGYMEIPETYAETDVFAMAHVDDCYFGEEVMKDES